jgi:hypothetical protein
MAVHDHDIFEVRMLSTIHSLTLGMILNKYSVIANRTLFSYS